MNVLSFYKKEILFFEFSNGNRRNPLKEFIQYIKTKKPVGIINFSLSSNDESLHMHLSIEENIIIDSFHQKLINAPQKYIQDKFNKIENPKILDLIATLPPLDTKLKDIGPMDIQKVSILKAVLSKSAFLFIVDDQDILKKEDMKLIKEILTIEVEEYHRKILLTATNTQKWLDIITYFVSRDPITQNFNLKENPFCDLYHKKPNKDLNQISLVKDVA